MDLKVIQRPILYIASHVKLGENVVPVPLGGLGGVTRAKNRALYVPDITEATAGIFVGKDKRNVIHATSYPYSTTDHIKQGIATSNAIVNKAFELLNGTKDMLIFICGGLANGAKKDSALIDRSHSLYYDIEECIEDTLPAKEGLDIQRAIIWGIKDAKKNLGLYVNNGSIVLEGEIFEPLFKNQKREYTHKELRNILDHLFEIVKIPEDWLLMGKKNYEPHKNPQEYILINKLSGKSI